jgi:hypothetical protein
MKNSIIPVERIEQKIYFIRGVKVMLDSDLAILYKVSTKSFNQAVKRNLKRFPKDFMFQLNQKEFDVWKSQFLTDSMRSQFVTASKRNIRYLPYVFTEQGVAMLASVLKSDRAIQMSILIIRAFVKLREMIATSKDLARKIENLEKKFKEHDSDIEVIFKAIKKLLEPPKEPPKQKIGFNVD